MKKECLRKEVDKEMYKKMYGGKAFRWRQRRI